MPELKDWDGVAGNNNSAAPDGAPEGMLISGLNNTVRELMAVMARWRDDNNGLLTSGGAADAQTLTPNGTYGAYFAGMTFVFKAGFTNTGAMTLNVGGLGAVNVLSHDGGALVAGNVTANGVYAVHHDGTQFKIVGGDAGSGIPATLTATTLSLASAVELTLASTTHALQLGADSGLNLVADTGSIQARNNGAKAELDLNKLGGNVIAGEDAANTDVISLLNLFTQIKGGSSTPFLIRNRTDGDPAKGATQNIAMSFLRATLAATIAKLGFQGSEHFDINVENNGGGVRLIAANAAAAQQTLATFDPDGASELYHAGTKHLETDAAGVDITGQLDLSSDANIGGDCAVTGAITGNHRKSVDLKTASYTLVLADAGKILSFDGAGAADQLTVPENASVAFPIGTEIEVAVDGSGGLNGITIVQGGATSIFGSSLTLANKRSAILKKINTDLWYVRHG